MVKTTRDNKYAIVEKLNKSRRKEIDDSFWKDWDFTSIWEKITEPINRILESSSDLIEKNPIFGASEELNWMNNDVQEVYKNVINKDNAVVAFAKKIPVLGNLVSVMTDKWDDANFNLKSLKEKLIEIFSGYDEVYESVLLWKTLQENFLEALEENITNLNEYLEYFDLSLSKANEDMKKEKDLLVRDKLKIKIENIQYYRDNLEVLVQNLDLSRQRLLIELDNSNKLATTMHSARPIYKSLITTALVERTTAKGTRAGQKVMEGFKKNLERMITEQTDNAIASHKKSEEMRSQTVIDSKVLETNVNKLKDYFDKMDEYKKSFMKGAESNRAILAKTKETLASINLMDLDDQRELENIARGASRASK